jgi:hypothetical protein
MLHLCSTLQMCDLEESNNLLGNNSLLHRKHGTKLALWTITQNRFVRSAKLLAMLVDRQVLQIKIGKMKIQSRMLFGISILERHVVRTYCRGNLLPSALTDFDPNFQASIG